MIIKTMINALLGRRRWMKIKRRHNVDKGNVYVIAMPDADREFNEFALRNIDVFLNYRKGNKAVVLTTDEWVVNNSSRFSERIISAERITEFDYHCYYCYHCYYYYGFSERFVAMSLRGKYGERLALADKVNGINKEELACLGLYIIRNWKKVGASHG